MCVSFPSKGKKKKNNQIMLDKFNKHIDLS